MPGQGDRRHLDQGGGEELRSARREEEHVSARLLRGPAHDHRAGRGRPGELRPSLQRGLHRGQFRAQGLGRGDHPRRVGTQGGPHQDHQQDREPRGPGELRGDREGHRRGHGGQGRPGHGDPGGEGLFGAEDDDTEVQDVWEARDHRHTDVGVHDQQPKAHARRGHRRGQRGTGRD